MRAGLQAAQEHDLPVVHHSLTWNPPYLPGYQDLWDNIFLGHLASHPWGGMRFMAAGTLPSSTASARVWRSPGSDSSAGTASPRPTRT